MIFFIIFSDFLKSCNLSVYARSLDVFLFPRLYRLLLPYFALINLIKKYLSNER